MASLIIQDAFEPYYAGREEDAAARARPGRRADKRPERAASNEIVLPEAAPAPTRRMRSERGVIAH